MNENYQAFFISIMTGVLPEHAFKLLDDPYASYMSFITDTDKEDMAQLYLNGVNWSGIAEIYNLAPEQVKNMVFNYKKKLKRNGVKLWRI